MRSGHNISVCIREDETIDRSNLMIQEVKEGPKEQNMLHCAY
jgi:hypothetical protein